MPGYMLTCESQSIVVTCEIDAHHAETDDPLM